MTKTYDRAYFDRWYRHSDVGVGQREFVTRKVTDGVARIKQGKLRPRAQPAPGPLR